MPYHPDYLAYTVPCPLNAGKRAQERSAYTPTRGKIVAFDLGMTTLLATPDGDLLGRDWRIRLERLDGLLQGIARGQQKRGLPVATPRYRALTKQLDGWLKTEIFRLVAWPQGRSKAGKPVFQCCPRGCAKKGGTAPPSVFAA